MPSGKTEEKGFRELSALAGAQPEEIRTRRKAAEDAYSAVRARLGAPGTYDLPGATPTGTGMTGAQAADDPSVWKTEKAKSRAATSGGRAGRIDEKRIAEISRLDPDAYVGKLEKSAEFRIASRLTAEAEQLIAREGPLYNEMIKNTQLPIIEGAGALARENVENLRRAAQRGGSARRQAMQAVQQIRAQERLNSQKVTALAQQRLEIDKWARDNARTQLEFNQNWAANLGGIRENFNQAMDMASELMVTKALPVMFAAQQEAAKWRYYAHSKNRSKVGSIISGVLGVASMALGGAGALGLLGGSLGKAVGGGGPLIQRGLELGTSALQSPPSPADTPTRYFG